METHTEERLSTGVEHLSYDHELRRFNDTVTWLAEVLPGHMRTPFEYSFDGRELYADDGSELKPIFEEAITKAKFLPDFEQRRRHIELDEYNDMIRIMKGELPNTMVVVSDFPPELMDSAEDMGGYNVSRKTTMLRVITRTPAGTLKMYSQSLDQSNRRALESIYESLAVVPEPGELLGQRIYIDQEEYDSEFLVDQLMGIYDRSMTSQFGGEWFAGRQETPPINTYEFVMNQKDLLSAYLNTTSGFLGGTSDYNLAAAMADRYKNLRARGALEKSFAATTVHIPAGLISQTLALEEMRSAGNVARQTGITFSGCGATITGRVGDQSPNSQFEELGYGNQADKLPDDKYGSRYFKCRNGHKNTRWQKNVLIERCQVCKCSVRC